MCIYIPDIHTCVYVHVCTCIYVCVYTNITHVYIDVGIDKLVLLGENVLTNPAEHRKATSQQPSPNPHSSVHLDIWFFSRAQRSIYMHIYIYMHVRVRAHIYIYIYIYICKRYLDV